MTTDNQNSPVAPQGEYPHEQMDAMALARYKVVPSHASMLWSHAVVAGDGVQQLYVGREAECQNMARKFAGAFLDGAFAFHSMAAAPTTQAAPALEAPAAPPVPVDEFRGDTPSLVRNIVALLELDADGALVPHGVGGHARGLLSAAAARLAAAPQAPAAPVLVGDGQADAYLADPGRLETLARSHPAGLVRALARAAMAAPAAPAEGEVLVEVIGLTGSGKSAICGEIEILCRALGLDVSWPDGDPEKNMTHAEWTAAIEAYKPRVRIVERNVPRQSNGGPAK